MGVRVLKMGNGGLDENRIESDSFGFCVRIALSGVDFFI
jgi:hypothetical protein